MADGILSGPMEVERHPRQPSRYPVVEAQPGLRVEHRASGTAGVVIEISSRGAVLRDGEGRDHEFRLRDGAFSHDGRPCTLVPARPGPTGPRPTASGSVAVEGAPARVARASRIWVEGIHDAELVEQVWGDDLRIEGIVVEPLGGIDDVVEKVRGFRPGPGRRIGLLFDHLVAGSKEGRLAAALGHPDVMVRGHPFVDIWAAVKPQVVGIDAWPEIPRDIPWKEGVCAALKVPEPAVLWQLIRRSVRGYTDLEPALVGSVEELIDFVTVRT